MPDPTENTDPTESTTADTQHAPAAEALQDTRIGQPYEGLMEQAAAETPYVPGETRIIGEPATVTEGAPISGVPTPEAKSEEPAPDQQPAEDE